MAVDMIYDLFKKHNPMLACIAEGHGILECSAIYRGLCSDNGQYMSIERIEPAIPFYQICHSSGKERNNHYRPGNNSRKLVVSEPVSIPHSIHRNTHSRRIEKQKYSSLFR
jgi:hypothetical protein